MKHHETRLSLGAGQELGNSYCIFSCQGLAARGPSKKQAGAGAVPVSSGKALPNQIYCKATDLWTMDTGWNGHWDCSDYILECKRN